MTKRKDGHVFVKSASGLVIPYVPPALDIESSAAREAEREPSYLLTTPGQAYEGRIHVADDGERELWLYPVEPYLEPELASMFASDAEQRYDDSGRPVVDDD